VIALNFGTFAKKYQICKRLDMTFTAKDLDRVWRFEPYNF